MLSLTVGVWRGIASMDKVSVVRGASFIHSSAHSIAIIHSFIHFLIRASIHYFAWKRTNMLRETVKAIEI